MMRSFFRNLKISKKLAFVFLSLFLIMGVGSLVALYNAGEIANVTERLYLKSFKRAGTLSTLENELLSARQELFLHTVTSDLPSQQFLSISISERRKKIGTLMSQYIKMGIAEKNRKLFEELEVNLVAYWHVQSKVMERSRIGDRDGALSIIRIQSTRIFSDTIEALARLVKEERDSAFHDYERSHYFATFIIYVTLALSLGAIILASVLWVALRRSIVRPILDIEESARRIEVGDLSNRAPVTSEDEIGNLAVEFNKMASSLEEYYTTLEKRVVERTDELRGANEELFSKKRELETANMELREANHMKSQFIANVSHELRTPLNSIIGFSELLGEKAFGELNDKQDQYVGFIHSSGEHLLKLINNILDLSKIEAGRMETLPEIFPISEVIGEVLGIMRPLAHEKNVTIEAKTVPASPKLRADRAKFKQILLNILSNAVKFNKSGGKVYLRWTVTEEPIGMEFQHFIIFSIEDTGVGIKEEDQGKLFKAFERVDSTITKEYDSTGLGLVLTKRLVELHGGEVWLKSKPGKGSTFFIKLPQGTSDIELPDFSDYAFASSGAGDHQSLLLASESPDTNHLLEIYLEGGDYDVVTASDGIDLLNKAQEEKPFAIIMGITLPKRDGWEVLKQLKSNPVTTYIPVIIISSIDNKELGYSLGAVEYLEKPIDKARLLSTLASLRVTGKQSVAPSRVLLIDNSSTEIEGAVEHLEKDGVMVFMSELDGNAAELASSCNPDCIIIRMQGSRKKFFDIMDRLCKLADMQNMHIFVFTPDTITEADKKRLAGGRVRLAVHREGRLSEDIVDVIRGMGAN